MAEIEISLIRRDGSEEALRRPLHLVGGQGAIKYKGKLWPLLPPGRLDLRQASPLDESVSSRHATMAEVAAFSQQRKGSEGGAPKTGSGQGGDTQAMAPAFPPPQDPENDDWDEDQLTIIGAGPAERLLVDAGPGTGKTAVACARIAALVGAGVPAQKIWLISFTRTAVQEIRDRIARLIGDPNTARAVQVATLDSLAWQLQRGYRPGAKLTNSFEDNIRALYGELSDGAAIQEYIAALRHLIVDEAQDVVGPRADLLVSLMGKLPITCGITVFADEAQAIYGFTQTGEDQDPDEYEPVPALPVRIRGVGLGKLFKASELRTVHRTEVPGLIRIFREVRRDVMRAVDDSYRRHLEVRHALAQNADGEVPADLDNALIAMSQLPDDSFILYRRRSDVLLTSSMLAARSTPHRLRISGQPTILEPWIGAALGEVSESRIGHETFSELWQRHVVGTPLTTIDCDRAWAILVAVGGDRFGRVVDMKTLRNRLASQAPSYLCAPSIGSGGPTISTIHAAKGREAATVYLMLPREPVEGNRPAVLDEETRVLFVGASRARHRLLVGKGFTKPASRLDGGNRVYRFFRRGGTGRVCVEVGQDGDLAPDGLVGMDNFSDADEARAAQHRLRRLADSVETVCAFADPKREWALVVRQGNSQGDVLCVLAPALRDDIWAITKKAVQFFQMEGTPRSPFTLPYLRIAGLRTLALSSGDPMLQRLHDPWRRSGFMLAPSLVGYCPFPCRTTQDA